MLIKRIGTASPEYDRVLRLRHQVLRVPIGLSLWEEDLSGDAADIILIALEGAELIGCLMLHPKDAATVKFRQMAVVPGRQGSGVGRQLVEEGERVAWSEGFARIELNAREVAAGFYDRLGYRRQGDLFTEVGIPHLLMLKEKEA